MQERKQRNADPRQITLDQLVYDLPEERIAQFPHAERDAANLLVYREGTTKDIQFKDLAAELPANTLLVLNDTRVIHARIQFRRATGAVIECMVLQPAEGQAMEQALNQQSGTRWWCMLGNAKRWKGEELTLEKEGHHLTMAACEQKNGEYLIEFRWDQHTSFLEQLAQFGSVPLPPYMRRAAGTEDDSRYNTVFAEHPGSVAAPTASLHFTPKLMEALDKKGIQKAYVTLHVGAGTFLPVKSATMQGHQMHSEQLCIPRATVERLLEQTGIGPIIPVGTTALRTIESLYWFGTELANGANPVQLAVEQWQPYTGQADVPTETALRAVLEWMDRHKLDSVIGNTTLLIAPGYQFRLTGALITNFHQPRSTLLLLVAALIGPAWREVYHHAIARGYRFLSYGDGSLLWNG